jgi:hypothetical protein
MGSTTEGLEYEPGRVNNFLFSTASRPAMGPTQPPIHWAQEAWNDAKHILCEHHHLCFYFIKLCITLMKTSHSDRMKTFCGHLYMTKNTNHEDYIMQFCPSFCYFPFHVTKYSSRHPVLKHLYLSMRLSFIPIQNSKFIVLHMFNFF